MTTVIFLCALLSIHGSWSFPAEETVAVNAGTSSDAADTGKASDNTVTLSFGTQLSNNMNDNLLKVMDNMRTGVVQVSTPVVKFGTDIVPNLLSSGFRTATSSASKILDAKKRGFKKILGGAANVVGGGAVLGSQVFAANMKMIGSGLGIGNDIISAAAKFGLDFSGNLADTAALSNMLFANITNGILQNIAGGMNSAAGGVAGLSQSSSKVIEAIGNSVSKSIGNAQETMAKWFKNGSAKIQNGAVTLSSTAQVNYYNALQWYLQNLMALEGVMDKLTETINSSGSKTDTTKVETETAKVETETAKVDTDTETTNTETTAE